MAYRWLKSFFTGEDVKNVELTVSDVETEDEGREFDEQEEEEEVEILSSLSKSYSKVDIQDLTKLCYTNEFQIDKYKPEKVPDYKSENFYKNKDDVFQKMGVEGDFSRDKENPNRIGKGGFGDVYKGRYKNPNQPKDKPEEVAVKILPLSKNIETMFGEVKGELFTLLKLKSHDNIITSRCHFIINLEELYIVMELANWNLNDMIKKSKTGLPVDEARRIFGQMLRGLAFMHGKRIAHRDIKPGNVLLVKSERGEWTAKLADFGFSVVAWSRKKGMQTVNDKQGTKSYMAPEIVRIGATDAEDQPNNKALQFDACQADIWAMGVCLYVMLTNEKPYEYHKYLQKIKQLKEDHPKKFKKAERKMFSRILEKQENNDFVKKLPPMMQLNNSPLLYDFLRRMMHLNPDLRLTAYECLQHPWMDSERNV